MKSKPKILTEYFKWRHNPSKGASVTLPEFGEEVELWWRGMQPKWRYNDETSPNNKRNYSYILSGGKKGAFLLVLCLAWWDQAYARDAERVKAERRAAIQAAGKDATTTNFDELPAHDFSWFNIVNDLIFVLELAQRTPIPRRETSGRRKRPAATTNGSPRKKLKA